MAAYPTSLKIAEDFNQVPRDGRMMDLAADGMARIRKLHDDRYEFVLTHKVLTAAQVAILEAHYLANLAASFAFVSPQDSVSYTVAYATRPTYKLHLGGAGRRMTATVRLTQTA